MPWNPLNYYKLHIFSSYYKVSTATTENPTIKQRRVVPLSFHDFPAFKGGYITVTTFHRLPLIGFSLSKTNSSRKTSMFFSAIAKCIAKKNGNFEMKKLDKLIKVNIKNQDLDPILASLEEKMKDSKEGAKRVEQTRTISVWPYQYCK
ncbi:hypothetical protein BDF21DRAFT_399807 [Thamnidium elegans]|nr:hypothetical protein BDF21DRAFT_399807 [Thamnidium elegans]